MNAEQRAALRNVAEKATPGPWSKYMNTMDNVIVRKMHETGYEQCVISYGSHYKNADHIAAANPQAILQLLDYIETLERDAGRYRWFSKYLVSDRTDLDDAIVACDSTVALNIVIDAAMGETE